MQDGRKETMVSDAAWRTLLCRAWPPGHYKRWYLRALQEEFDARALPSRLGRARFRNRRATGCRPCRCPAHPTSRPCPPAIATMQLDVGAGPPDTELRPRSHSALARDERAGSPSWPNRSGWSGHDPRRSTSSSARPTRSRQSESLAVETAPGQWQVELDGHVAPR